MTDENSELIDLPLRDDWEDRVESLGNLHRAALERGVDPKVFASWTLEAHPFAPGSMPSANPFVCVCGRFADNPAHMALLVPEPITAADEIVPPSGYVVRIETPMLIGPDDRLIITIDTDIIPATTNDPPEMQRHAFIEALLTETTRMGLHGRVLVINGPAAAITLTKIAAAEPPFDQDAARLVTSGTRPAEPPYGTRITEVDTSVKKTYAGIARGWIPGHHVLDVRGDPTHPQYDPSFVEQLDDMPNEDELEEALLQAARDARTDDR